VSAWKLAAYGPLWLTEFLSLNKTNFVKLTQHASFGREKLLTKQKSRCKKKIVAIDCHHCKAYLENLNHKHGGAYPRLLFESAQMIGY